MSTKSTTLFVEDLGNGNLRVTEGGGKPAVISRMTCTDATRPAATKYPIGFGIWNLDDNAYNYSDGTNWRTAGGTIT